MGAEPVGPPPRRREDLRGWVFRIVGIAWVCQAIALVCQVLVANPRLVKLIAQGCVKTWKPSTTSTVTSPNSKPKSLA